MPEPLVGCMLDLERYVREDNAFDIREHFNLATGNIASSTEDHVEEVTASGVLDADTR
jgi:hypothetical protein